MNKEDQKLLDKFQCEYNRSLEEDFAKTLSEKEFVRLFFINEGQPYTDGRNVIVDPSLFELFTDKKALKLIEEFLQWPSAVLADQWNVLKISTRAQTIHECLHLIYSDIPGQYCFEQKYDTRIKKHVIALISNIIEDAYIEAVGCEYFDNMDYYLRFGRVSCIFSSHEHTGTAQMVLQHVTPVVEKTVKSRRRKIDKLLDYLNYMSGIVLYPMLKLKEPRKDIDLYVKKTKKLFLDGCLAESPSKRYEFSAKIYEIITPLIPKDRKIEKLLLQFSESIIGNKTHYNDNSSGLEHSKGQTQSVSTRLFTDKDGKLKQAPSNLDSLMSAVSHFSKEAKEVENILSYEGSSREIAATDYDCAPLHKIIKINESRPKPELNLKRAYQNVLEKYSSVIRANNSRFSKILQSFEVSREDKKVFGAGISSSRLGDPKGRYWYRMLPHEEPLDLAVLLLIDGSGSMSGERREAAVMSAVILHEVLKRQNISHSVVEHRAYFDDPKIDINILLDFNCRKEEQLNLLKVSAHGDNRDALALYWSEKYLNTKVENKYKLIISISDGSPCHSYDDYYPPVSSKDTADSVKKIQKRGIHIIGISLDSPGECECYSQLKEIYPNLVACNDLSRLPMQVLGVVSKLLNK